MVTTSLLKSRLRRARRHVCAAVFSVWILAALHAAGQTEDPEAYLELWERGEYQQALFTLLQKIELADGYVPPRQIRHRARLRLATGHIDDAINDMELMATEYPEPANTLELALLYRQRGLMEQYRAMVRRGNDQAQSRSWRYSRREENNLAICRIAELIGQNPKTILSAYFGSLLERSPNSTRVRVAAGQLAFRKAAYNIAAEHFNFALDLEPTNQDALAGLCECYWQSRDPRLGETLAKLDDVNPNHPDLAAIKVEQLLDLGKAEETLAVIDNGLEINPVNLRLLALRSAAYFLMDDFDSMGATQQEVLAFNPYYSEVFRTTGRLASRHYRFREGADFQLKALQVDPADYQSRALYTQDLLRLGEEVAGRDELDEAFKADPYNVHLFNLLELMDTLETFETVERGAFLLRLPANEAPVLAEAALDLLDEAIGQFEAKYEVELKRPVLIEMFDNHDDFMVRSVGLPGNAGHLGICFGNLITMDTPSARTKGSTNWRSVLWHEFVHVVTLQKTHNRMPRWLSEGISVYEEGQAAPAWRNKLDPSYKKLIEAEGLPEVADITFFFIQPKSPGHLMFGYFIAGEFAQFYIDEYGQDALNAALESIGGGTEATAALANAASQSLEEVNKTFHDYLDVRLAPYDNLPSTKPPESGVVAFLKRLFTPSGETKKAEGKLGESAFLEAIKEADVALDAKEWNGAETALKRAHELFPDYTEADAPLRKLAELYRAAKKPQVRKEVLLQIIESTPAELEVCKELIDILREEEDWEELARVAEWTLGIDPYDISVYKALMETPAVQSDSARALDTLAVLSHLDAPHKTGYRMRRAGILADMGDAPAAKQELLEVLESVPHFWDAQRLLLKIIAEPGSAEDAPAPAGGDSGGP